MRMFGTCDQETVVQLLAVSVSQYHAVTHMLIPCYFKQYM